MSELMVIIDNDGSRRVRTGGFSYSLKMLNKANIQAVIDGLAPRFGYRTCGEAIAGESGGCTSAQFISFSIGL